jgi:hypothetical protein
LEAIFLLIVLVKGGFQVVNERFDGSVAMCEMSKAVLAKEWIMMNEPEARVVRAECRSSNGGGGA